MRRPLLHLPQARRAWGTRSQRDVAHWEICTPPPRILDTPLPLIDIVNENLESLVTTIPANTAGVIYDTEETDLDSHKICPSSCGSSSEESSEGCHSAAELFATLPEYSAPATPVALPAAYAALKSDFSTPSLPYSEPLDICRSYLEELQTCRFETMRTHRKEITECALDPTLIAPEFQTHLWRFPVRLDTAIEYLGMTPEEYQLLFVADIATVPTAGLLLLPNLYGFADSDPSWIVTVTRLPEFLRRTGLSYCELVELQRAGFIAFDATNETRPHLRIAKLRTLLSEPFGNRFHKSSGPADRLKGAHCVPASLAKARARLWRAL